jgi:hypothetical protein
MNTTSEERLAAALERLATALDRNSYVMELFIEAMPATVEANLLGVSSQTIRRRRKRRRAERLLSASW